MSAPFLYAPYEKPLRQVAASTGNVVSIPEVLAIPNGGYSEIFSGGSGLEAMLEFIFGAAATGDVIIEKVASANAAVAGTTFDSVTATAELSKNWSSQQPISGYFRVRNTSGQTCTCYLNFRIN